MPIYMNGGEPDELLNTNGFTLLTGMLLDQQVPMEWAFHGPFTLQERLGHLDPMRIAALPVDDLVAVALTKPAIHRFPATMARRIHDLAVVVTEQYDGDAAQLWNGVKTGDELYRRLRSLPGFGDEKARIFLALLAKRMGVRPRGWQAAAGVFAGATPRSVADSAGPAALEKIRGWKKAQKAANKDKQDRPLAAPRPR